MFNIIKKWFRKTENFENNENFSENQIITFNDLKGDKRVLKFDLVFLMRKMN